MDEQMHRLSAADETDAASSRPADTENAVKNVKTAAADGGEKRPPIAPDEAQARRDARKQADEEAMKIAIFLGMLLGVLIGICLGDLAVGFPIGIAVAVIVQLLLKRHRDRRENSLCKTAKDDAHIS